MSKLRLPPRLLIVSLLTLFAAATDAHAQAVNPGSRDNVPGSAVRSDPRASVRESGYPRSKDELFDPARNQQRQAKRLAGSAISDGRKALREDPPDYLKAKQLFAYAARLNPEDERAYVGLGDVNTAMRRFPEAAAAYAKAVEINEKSGEAHYGLGVMYHAQGRKDAAQDELQVLRSLKKKDLAAKLEALLAG
ncbi:MAG TPA: tetratricopeptide repeat protein [Pyrinomonadaceae bacterium]|jgi:tetratricopeptide (TPR) repeat protein